MITRTRLAAVAAAAALFLAACGGGGGGGGTAVSNAVISGQVTGSVSTASPTASGTLTVTDADPGEATFQEQSQLAGFFGTWSWTVNGASGTWQYTADSQLTPSVASEDTLVIYSKDGVSQVITVAVAAGVRVTAGNLVTSVPAPTYTRADGFDAERQAIFDRLNADRSACGFGKVKQDVRLDNAAQGHVGYIKLNDLTHFQIEGNPGFTGVSPSARVAAAGYSAVYNSEGAAASFTGGNSYFPISPTVLSATNALAMLYTAPYHMAALLGRNTDIGIGVEFKPNTGGFSDIKLVSLTYATHSGTQNQFISSDAVATFPCDGITAINPIFPGENPNPYPHFNPFSSARYGHPIYIMARSGQTVTVTSASIIQVGGAEVPHLLLTKDNDPNRILGSHQVFVQPTVGLADNAQYDVVIHGTNTGMVTPDNPTGSFTQSFRFGTGTFATEL